MHAAPSAKFRRRRGTLSPGPAGLPALSAANRRPGGPGPRPSRGLAGRADPGGLLSEDRREALGLALAGGLGYARASRALGTYPRDLAALLHTALRRLASSSATTAVR